LDLTVLTKRRGKKFVVLPFLIASNFTQLKIILFVNRERNKCTVNFGFFFLKKLSPSSHKYRDRIWDPEKNPILDGSQIPDPGVCDFVSGTLILCLFLFFGISPKQCGASCPPSISFHRLQFTIDANPYQDVSI
jgi:hypothetical protein